MSGDKIAAVILGASKWPGFNGELYKSTSFEQSAAAFTDYLTDDQGLKVPPANILPLFESNEPPSIIDDKIREFLRDRTQHAHIEDIIIYYSGHGSFTSDKKYMLILGSTKRDNVDITAYKIRDLAKCLNDVARLTRKWVILDSCSSAAAFGDLQPLGGEVIKVIAEEAKTIFPAKGTALLCASSADEVARAPKKGDYTMFSGALIDVLKKGSINLGEGMSLSEVYELVADEIAGIYQSDSIRPEVYTPDQKQGDLSKIPFFPNPAKLPAVISRRLDLIEQVMRQLENARGEIAPQYSQKLTTMENRMSKAETDTGTVLTKVEDFGSRLTELQGRLAQLDSNLESRFEAALESRLEKADLRNRTDTLTIDKHFGISDEEWFEIPDRLKRKLYQWSQSKRNGLYLLAIAVIMLIHTLAGAVLGRSVSFEVRQVFFTSLYPLPMIFFLFLALGAFRGAVWQRQSEGFAVAAGSSQVPTGDADWPSWRSYEVIDRAQIEIPISIFSFMGVERRLYIASMGILLIDITILGLTTTQQFLDLLAPAAIIKQTS